MCPYCRISQKAVVAAISIRFRFAPAAVCAVYGTRFRQKLADAQSASRGGQELRIETVRGVGYRLMTRQIS